jgi:hypothetical protein
MKTLINFCTVVILSLLVFAIIFLSQIYFTNDNNIFLITTISLVPSIFNIIILTNLLYNPK